MTALLWTVVLLLPTVVLLTCGARGAHNAARREREERP